MSKQSAPSQKIPHGKEIRTVSIVGTGSYAPERILTNAELEKIVDTTDEWIVTRTGIRERHIARDDEATSDLAAAAARRALEDAGVKAEDLDMIIVATITPDMPFPNTACLVQNIIGAKKAFCFDIEAACSGFVYALEIGRQFVASGTVETALIIGAEKMSSMTNWKDRSTCVLFGDGAGAAVLQARGAERGIMTTVMGSDGALADLLMVPGGGSRLPASEATIREGKHYLLMEGREVFKHAVTKMTGAAKEALDRCGVAVGDVTLIIPHQANNRIIQAIAQRLDVPGERVYSNVERYGNTSGASIIIALDEAVKAGRLKRHDLLLVVAFGGGFTWGASLLEWYKE
ncbi:MAG: ketoacyl-ACP synthase III [Kiritimatiellae bacterium]|nr:ketoacyl-ACP synthase III [Kiritimatiellia bacterium]